jgi:hypothetical protein
MCHEKGVSPWNYIAGFVTGWLLVFFVASAVIVFIYGRDVVNHPDLQKDFLPFYPFILLFHFLLFIFFRQKIAHLPDYNEDDDDTHFPPSDEKKDLSYFR